MDLLDTCLQKRVRLIDYECIRERGQASAPRLVAFGEFAGKAGVINAFRGLGHRLLSLGHSTPFLNTGAAHSYPDYASACDAISRVGESVKQYGLPPSFSPMVFVFAGMGNVTRGALDAFERLGSDVATMVPHEELNALSAMRGAVGEHNHKVYGCVVGADAMVADKDGGFDRDRYYAHPNEFRPIFHEKVAPHTSVLVLGMYWERRFPRLLTAEQLSAIRRNGNHSLLQIADITCDVDGATDMLVRASTIDEPFYMYDVEARAESGAKSLEGPGVAIMGVDILPSELPREASAHFGDALMPFVPALARAEAHSRSLAWASQPLSRGGPVPDELWAATICCDGALTQPYAYIAAMRATFARAEAMAVKQQSVPLRKQQIEGSTVLSLSGHLFDSGYINEALDVVEAAGGRFELLNVSVRPNPRPSKSVDGENAMLPAGARSSLETMRRSSALLQLTLDQGRPALDGVIHSLHALATRNTRSEAVVTELPDYCGGVYEKTVADCAASADDTAYQAPTPPTVGHAPPFVGKPSTAALRSATGANASAERVQISSRGFASAASRVPQAKLPPLLVLGAGLCAQPAVELLSRDESRSVTVVSSVPGEAAAVCAAVGRPNLRAATLSASPTGCPSADPSDWTRVVALIEEADGCLSLLPPPMHASVASACVQHRTPLVTASYVSDELRALDADARSHRVPILCEMGLDPGLDHMSAKAIIDRVHADGGRVISFRSVCGGIPAPEVAFTTPLLYKFSWSPAGVLAAIDNGAQYLENGKLYTVSAEELLDSAAPLLTGCVGKAFRLEVLPNRDALPHGELYGIAGEAQTLFRGTLRYQGWSDLMRQFKLLGLTDANTLVPAGVKTWDELLRNLRVAASPHQKAYFALQQLGALNDAPPVQGTSLRDAFCQFLQQKLAYAGNERDAVLLEHELVVEFNHDEDSRQLITSSLVGFGQGGGESFMARSVGTTAAVGLQYLVSQPHASRRGGVLLPMQPEIYKHVLSRLEEEGISFTESSYSL